MISEKLEEAIGNFKELLEKTIKTAEISGQIFENGLKAKTSLIRSSKLINIIHDAIKFELIELGIEKSRINPLPEQTKPEIKLYGYLTSKYQDICVFPENISKKERLIDWGPLKYSNIKDQYGQEYLDKTLVINVRSQLSSLSKNVDTLFERTFAETLNLHLNYPKMVIGEVFLIPVDEYDEKAMENNRIMFKKNNIYLSKYISFFAELNDRTLTKYEPFKYERCALIIVDFKSNPLKIYTTTQELIDAGLIKNDSKLDFTKISIDGFTKDIKNIYDKRFK